MNPLSFGTQLKTISVYRQTTTQSARGSVTATWTLHHTISNVDIQPVSADVLRLLEGNRDRVEFDCFHTDSSIDIANGDRVLDPLDSGATSPKYVVRNVQKWPPMDGLLGHCRFLLERLG